MITRDRLFSVALPVALLLFSREPTPNSFPLRGLICPAENQIPEIITNAYNARADIGWTAERYIAAQRESKCTIYYTHLLRGEITRLVRTIPLGGHTFYLYEVRVVGEVVEYEQRKPFIFRYPAPMIRFTFTDTPIEVLRERARK